MLNTGGNLGGSALLTGGQMRRSEPADSPTCWLDSYKWRGDWGNSLRTRAKKAEIT